MSYQRPPASDNILSSSFTSRSFHAFDQEQQQKKSNQSFLAKSVSSFHQYNNGSAQKRPAEWYPTSGTPDEINKLEIKNSASSVVLAFRELQEKAKQIEYERINAASEVDELRRRLTECKRNESLLRSRTEIRTTDEVLLIRENSERLLQETGELQVQLARVSELSQSIHRDIAFQRARGSELSEDISRGHVEAQTLEFRLSQLQEDLHLSSRRTNDLEEKLLSLSSSKSVTITSDHRLKTLQNKITKEKAASLRTTVRITALQRYMEIILQVNGDLTEALKAKEASSSRIFRIVESHTRHMASRDSLHYKSTNDLLHVPNESPSKKKYVKATTTVNEAVSQRRKKKKKSSKKQKMATEESISSMNEQKQKRKKVKTKVPSKKSTKKSSIKSALSSDSDASDDLQDAPSRLYTDDNYEASLLSRIAELRQQKELYARALKERENELEHEHETINRNPNVSLGAEFSQKKVRDSGDQSMTRAVSQSGSGSKSTKTSNHIGKFEKTSDSSRSGWLLKQNLNPRFYDTGKDDIARMYEKPKSFTRSSSAEGSSRGRQKQRGSSPRRSLSRESGLVQTAGRLVATAAATQIAAAANAESSGRVGRIFVPSSPCDSKEFNVMASVSKAAKSARELNATLASRVKSLDFDGAGPQFNEIAKIDLSDMHDYLSVVKKLRESQDSR